MTSSTQPQCCDFCKIISIKKDRPLTHGGGYPVVGCNNPSCECHQPRQEWEERFKKKYGWIEDFDTRNGIIAFIASERKALLEEIDMRSGYTAGKQEGRKKVLEELLRETYDVHDTCISSECCVGKSIDLIEKKLHEHD